MPGWPALIAETVTVGAHAAERCRHRAKPGLDLHAARGELERLPAIGTISAREPRWLRAANPAPCHLLISDAIVLPLLPQAGGWVARIRVTQQTLAADVASSELSVQGLARRAQTGAAPGPVLTGAAVLLAAHTAGERSPLGVLIALGILMWALAGAGLLLGWLWRLAHRRRTQHRPRAHNDRPPSRSRARLGRARDRSAGAGAPPADRGAQTGSPPDRAAERAPGPTAPVPTGPPPAIPGARLLPEQLELLGRDLDNSRRLAACEARVAPVLATLRADRWLVERYVLIASHRVPFLLVGETGVFVLWAMAGPLQWRDLSFFDEIARYVENALPGYAGTVQPGVCRVSEPDIKPRWWCRPGEPGAWLIGLNWLIAWLEHFGPEHGLGVEDLERLRALAGPRWGRPVTDVPLSAHVPTIG
ncbi:MAG: hypothetical protein ACRDMJ_19740 [Solirubrobacteraceae bacterium]